MNSESDNFKDIEKASPRKIITVDQFLIIGTKN